MSAFSAVVGGRQSQAVHILRVRSSVKRIFSRAFWMSWKGFGFGLFSAPSSCSSFLTQNLKEGNVTDE